VSLDKGGPRKARVCITLENVVASRLLLSKKLDALYAEKPTRGRVVLSPGEGKKKLWGRKDPRKY